MPATSSIAASSGRTSSRGRRASARARGEQPPQFFLDTKEQPYLTPPERPFELIRVWGHGGKTNVWGRVSLRYSDLDFKGAATRRLGDPWPIDYADVAPYYDKVEQLIGVCGGNDDSDVAAGQQVPAAAAGAALRRAAAAEGVRQGRHPDRRRPPRQHDEADARLPAPATTAATAARAATRRRSSAPPITCCRSRSRPASSRSARTPSSARILVDDKGLAEGVQYFDRKTGAEHRVLGKVVVIGASASTRPASCSTRSPTQYPNGIGNGSDVIGRYLCEQIRVHVRGFLPRSSGTPTRNDRGIGGEHIYMPRFNHRAGRTRDSCAATGCSSGTPAPARGRARRQRADPGLRRRR